ncbi:sensor histidine kinase [Falsiroseomonas selenitidurans]|uniref:histidine kinase n=1 Tax=Falsiroseomonas selenitidurans TaxID=2716335 RepID=A0ABX1EA74_9PROT|nr:histidine kinase dimerization/phosphoacceptor domain -containing protein [Falsiroseomonas selenitidurans]NKC34081.1 GAF domain-containing protein [Falsiroseomonas selenitidurans]
MSDRAPPESGGELRRRLRQQQLISAFGREALRGPELAPLLQEAACVAAEGLGTDLAKVLQHLPGESALLIVAAVGWQSEVVGIIRFGADLGSPAGYALQTGAPVISNHLGREGRFRTPQLMRDHGVRRAVNVLIRGEAGAPPFGVLEVDSRDAAEAFSESDVDFLQALANVVGLAIDRDRDRRDRDLLTREAHHRVKNSLQIAQTLLRLQLREVEDPEARRQLEQAARRIMTIGAVHERLFSGPAIGQVAVGTYLRGLMEDLRSSIGMQDGDRPLELHVSARSEMAVWDGDRVTNLGLVATELVTNAFKYGRGPVVVALDVQPDGAGTMTVTDGGDGPARDFEKRRGGGLGMRILATLLRGGGLTPEWLPGGGFRFIARLPAPPGAGAEKGLPGSGPDEGLPGSGPDAAPPGVRQ